MARILEMEQMDTALTIGRTYWTLPCLETLCDVKSMERFIRAHSKKPTDKFVRGYSLAIVLLLGWLLDVIVDNNPFDLGEDFAVSRAFQSDTPFDRMPTDSELGKLVRKIALLYIPLFRPGSLEALEPSARHIQDLLLTPLRTVFEHSVEVDPRAAKKAGSDKRLCLRRLGLVNVHLFLCELKKVEIGFYHTFLRNKGGGRRTPPAEFYAGYKMAVAFLLESLREPGSQDRALKLLLRSRSWNSLENQYRGIQSELVTPLENAYGINDFMFVKSRTVPEHFRPQLLFTDTTMMKTTYSTRERLDQWFFGFDTKIVGDEGITFSSVAGVITALMGGLAMQRDEPVRIVKFEHRVSHGSDFSYAVLVPAYSNIGNYSEWWVFPDFCNNVTGGGGSGYFYLTEFIDRVRKRWKDRINYREIQVDLNEFLNYVKAPSTARPRRELERDSALLGEARGWLLELATGSILRAKGFNAFHRIKNTSIMGDLELDVVGLKYDKQAVRIAVAECSTRFSPKDTSRVRTRIKVLRETWRQLLAHLKLPVPETAAFEGWIVTTSRLPASKTKMKTINVVDSRKMERLASEHGIPWNKVKRLFAEEPRIVRVLHARGLAEIARVFEKERV